LNRFGGGVGSMAIETLLTAIAGAAAGGAAAFFVFRARERALRAEAAARFEAEARDLRARALTEASQSLDDRRQRLDEEDKRLRERESVVNRQLDRLGTVESDLRIRAEAVDAASARVEEQRRQVERQSGEWLARIEALSGTTAEAARRSLLGEVETRASREAAEVARAVVERARHTADDEARRIIAIAVQRYAGRHAAESSTALVALPGDDMKGRIIGRDGRNIRAFEAATGVTVLVDDTPHAVVLSGFDPVRREVARQAMERLVLDGRIHPARIEEVVTAVNQEMDQLIRKMGEDAAASAVVALPDAEVVRILGRLNFRHSFSQNVLQHSIEVAHLCGLMASELGADPVVARRSGLFHDIGKALSQEMQGPHAIVGADFLRRNGEGPVVVNAVAAHHDEVPHESVYGILVSAADAISASRPGSRSEGVATYLQRLQSLEQLAMDFAGVEKAFAMQAGRELRVIVRHEAVTDEQGVQMARDIARRVEDELTYPGQIRVTVIRETRCVEYAK